MTTARSGRRVQLGVVLPPGKQLVEFASSAEPMYPPDDFRQLVFAVHNFKLTATNPL